jgi:hypothetical protein
VQAFGQFNKVHRALLKAYSFKRMTAGSKLSLRDRSRASGAQ